ncbi:DUF262 domain-containing protein [uncultured Chryseobacterium sp.]|jgi:Uncharacterized conserved protein|uniref:DUF262 domain-containing protein n=1 Tax=uncultured Chryseobacterium sp. TaxID=259322 RepID=UPI002602306D|nr:DUF262 domain-containing HNH endonuclease family protein [uncultured Chryseobacterium sp.]
MKNNDIQAFSLENIYSSGKYLIPLYQRNYAWREGQIVQLIHDIKDFAKTNYEQNYYIGTLVVYKRENEKDVYETIDGQQRLTTLNILYSVLKNEYFLESELSGFKKIILDFENRILSTRALELAYKGAFDLSANHNPSIENAYKIIVKELKTLFGDHQNINSEFHQFINYLNKKVILLRVNVPKETDLNHYFEIMNNRGEQLEKHEVLKSTLLSYLDKIDEVTEREKSKILFNTIWEGCSQMERYIQYAFKKDQRHRIFGDTWDQLVVTNFDELLNVFDFSSKSYEDIGNTIEEEGSGVSIDDIIRNNSFSTITVDGTSETSERFNSVINFQNFLLHCLLVLTKSKDATLDDKRLIKNFDFLSDYSQEQKIAFVKEYSFCILKSKFLFDQYIIKREFQNNKEGWSLKRLHYYSNTSQSYIYTFGNSDEGNSDSREIIWLLSMFHTVAPNMMYKHWLNASLKYLFENYSIREGISSGDYIEYLQTIVKKFVFKRFLSDHPMDYYDMIYSSNNLQINEEEINWSKLRYDQIQNNLIFNYIDYLLIQKELHQKSDIPELFNFISNYEFTFRSSVEHYYPQNPKDGHEKIADEYLHSIGNLTLISHSKNSAMNNYQPKAKKEHYRDGATADSVKQYLMFNKYPDLSWGINEIEEHEKEIILLLNQEINEVTFQ